MGGVAPTRMTCARSSGARPPDRPDRECARPARARRRARSARSSRARGAAPRSPRRSARPARGPCARAPARRARAPWAFLRAASTRPCRSPRTRPMAPAARGGGGGTAAFVPGGVGGQDEGRDPARRGARGGHRFGAVGCHRQSARRGAQPFRIGARDALDVGVERGVILLVVGRVVADHVDDRRARAARIVQIGEAVAEPRCQMKQRRGRLLRHAAIAVGGAGDDALEQARTQRISATRSRAATKCISEVPGLVKHDIDAARDQRARQAFGSVQLLSPQPPPAML